MEASVLDLRREMGEVMSAIDRHEKVTLTCRGRRKAVIVPLKDWKKETPKVADLPAFGMWADRNDLDDVSAHIREIRKPGSF